MIVARPFLFAFDVLVLDAPADGGAYLMLASPLRADDRALCSDSWGATVSLSTDVIARRRDGDCTPWVLAVAAHLARRSAN